VFESTTEITDGVLFYFAQNKFIIVYVYVVLTTHPNQAPRLKIE
jgi:hypothetical protein